MALAPFLCQMKAAAERGYPGYSESQLGCQQAQYLVGSLECVQLFFGDSQAMCSCEWPSNCSAA